MNLRIAQKILKRVRDGVASYSEQQIATAKRRVAKHTWHVSAYKVDRVYGGAEEGGWWTDWYQLEYAKAVIGLRQARIIADRLHKRQEECFDQDAYNREAWARLATLPDPDQIPCPVGGSEGYIPAGFSEGEKMVFLWERQAGENQSTPEQLQYC